MSNRTDIVVETDNAEGRVLLSASRVYDLTEDKTQDTINGEVKNTLNQLDADLTALGDPVAVAHGGTGSATAAGARTNLGLGAAATKAVANNLTTASSGGSVLDAYQGKVVNDKLTTHTVYSNQVLTALHKTSGDITLARYGKLRIMNFNEVVVPYGYNVTIQSLPSTDAPAFYYNALLSSGDNSYPAEVWIRTNATVGTSNDGGKKLNGQIVWIAV